MRSAKRGTEILLYRCRMGKLKFFREVSVILDWLDGKLDWSIFAVVIPIGAAAMLLMGLLTFVWEFDLAVSPAWQVGIFHLALVLLLSITFVVASRRPFSFSGGFRWFTMTVSLLIPAAVGEIRLGELVGEPPLRGVQGRPDLQWGSGLRLRIHAGLDEYHLPVYRSCVRKEVNQIPARWGSPLSRLGRRYPCNRHTEPIVRSKNIWILFR